MVIIEDNMRKAVIVSLAALMVAVLPGCNKTRIGLAGYTDSTTIPAPNNYKGIEVGNGIETVILKDTDRIYVESDANVLPYVEVYESEGVLRIKYSDGISVPSRAHTYVEVPYRPDIGYLSGSGGATVSCRNTFFADNLSVNASGGSMIEFNTSRNVSTTIRLSGGSVAWGSGINTERLYIEASGGSVIYASGSAAKCEMDLGGGSELFGNDSKDELYIEKCYGSLSGGSWAGFSSDGTIECSLSGGSTIDFTGTATDNSICSGGSSVNRH